MPMRSTKVAMKSVSDNVARKKWRVSRETRHRDSLGHRPLCDFLSQPQVRLDNSGIVSQIASNTFHGEFAGLEHISVIRYLQRSACILLDQQCSDARLTQRADDMEYLLHY